MPKFRFYITDILSADVVGTNDAKVAQASADDSDFVVVDTEHNQWMQPTPSDGRDAVGQDIQEQTRIVLG